MSAPDIGWVEALSGTAVQYERTAYKLGWGDCVTFCGDYLARRGRPMFEYGPKLAATWQAAVGSADPENVYHAASTLMVGVLGEPVEGCAREGDLSLVTTPWGISPAILGGGAVWFLFTPDGIQRVYLEAPPIEYWPVRQLPAEG